MEKEKNTVLSKVFTAAGGLLLLMLIGIVVCSLSASKRNEPLVLIYAELNPLDGTVPGEMAKAFKEKAEELSGGRIIIDLHPGGVLGGEEQLIDNMLGGGNLADITRISALELSKYGCDSAGLVAIPYTFEDADHFWKFAGSEIAEKMLLEPHDKGLHIRGLCYAEEGFRHFFFSDEISGLEDLKRKKIRVNSDPVMTGMVTDIGGYATIIPFTELYSSLSTGVVDGAEQPLNGYLSNGFNEVAPYLLLDGHTLGVMELVISEYTWDRMTPEQQDLISQAAAYASQVCREKGGEIEESTLKELKEAGTTIVEVEDKRPWVNSCQNTIEKFVGDNKDTYDKIVKLADE